MFSINIRRIPFRKWGIFRRCINWKWQDWLRSLGKNVFLLTVVGYLFYGVFWGAAAACPLLPFLVVREYDLAEKRKRERMALAFREALQSMSAALHAGYAAENSVREAVRDLRTVYGDQAEIVCEFRRMWNEIQMQIPVEQVWNSFGERSGIPVIRDFAVVFRTAKRSGGDLTAIMDNTAEAIGEKLRVQQEIETILAAKRLEWRIMMLIPFGIILYMKVSFSEFMGSMYGNPAGILIMSIALGLFIAALVLGEKILDFGIWE